MCRASAVLAMLPGISALTAMPSPAQRCAATAFYHPQVGPLDLHYTILHLPDPRQMIVTYHADPGSPSEENLRLLASLAT
jgi:hypothetical protein